MELSKYYKNGRHAGWKKFVHGRSIHIITGTSSQNYLFAIKFAEALLKRGEQLKASGESWDDSIIQAVKASVDLPSAQIAERETPLVPPSVQAVATPASPSASSDLYAVIEQYKKAERLRASSRKITDDHCRNQCEHIETAKQGLRDPIELRIYRGADGVFMLYEEESDSYRYEKGAFATIPMQWSETKKTLTLGDRAGEFHGMLKERTFHIIWVRAGKGVGPLEEASPDTHVKYTGTALEVTAPQ